MEGNFIPFFTAQQTEFRMVFKLFDGRLQFHNILEFILYVVCAVVNTILRGPIALWEQADQDICQFA